MTTPVPEIIDTEPNYCFTGSRRLTGANRYFNTTAVILTPLGCNASNDAALQAWQHNVEALAQALGWALSTTIIHRHATGVFLLFSAPADQLFTATDVNEWAWEEANNDLFERDSSLVKLHQTTDPAAYFSTKAKAEARPDIQAIANAAAEHGLPCLVDDEALSIGAGAGSKTWLLANLPAVHDIDFASLHDIPTVLVTGSNGKTTTTRLLAAMLNRTGIVAGYCSTEGVIVNNEATQTGDLSGPAGARAVLRDTRVGAAVLETARGGISRRGLSMQHAHCAVVTNITADHFGEYGVDNLEDLAEVKLTVARVLEGRAENGAALKNDQQRWDSAAKGTLVLNADDATLSERATQILSAQRCHVALFALNHKHPQLQLLRKAGRSTCGVENEKLMLHHNGISTSLGAVNDMPLTLNGAAQYNIANIAAASLAAAVLQVAPADIAYVASHFGRDRADNPGRLSQWKINGATILLDYAHNPDGLAALLDVAIAISSVGLPGSSNRLGILLGQAGNRDNEALNELAIVAAHAEPAMVIIKELPHLLRGRAIGEVSERLQTDLIEAGVAPNNIVLETDEVAAAKRLVNWASTGDVVVLPVHTMAAREDVVAWLDAGAVAKC
jgi:cyanophycin synthetase